MKNSLTILSFYLLIVFLPSNSFKNYNEHINWHINFFTFFPMPGSRLFARENSRLSDDNKSRNNSNEGLLPNNATKIQRLGLT